MRPICLDLYSLGNNCPASPPNEHLFPALDTILVHHETAHFLSDMFMCIAFLPWLLVARWSCIIKHREAIGSERSACSKHFLYGLVREEINSAPVCRGNQIRWDCFLWVVAPSCYRIFDSLTFLNSCHFWLLSPEFLWHMHCNFKCISISSGGASVVISWTGHWTDFRPRRQRTTAFQEWIKYREKIKKDMSQEFLPIYCVLFVFLYSCHTDKYFSFLS